VAGLDGGGRFPAWRRDGKELFYIAADGKLTAVEVKVVVTKTSATFAAGAPKALFDSGIRRASIFLQLATPDGRRFLINTKASEEKSRSITVVVNWQAGLKK
jgi:hypothetical protein